jgi:hypothetical protein
MIGRIKSEGDLRHFIEREFPPSAPPPYLVLPELPDDPEPPLEGAVYYVTDNAGTKEARVIFENGNVKMMADDT